MPASFACRWQACKQANKLRKRLAVVFGQIADALAHLVRHGLSAPSDLTGVGFEHAEDDAHGGGLTGAVGPDEPEHLALGDGERQVVQGDQVAVAAGQALQLQHVVPPVLAGMSWFGLHDSSGAGCCRPAGGGTRRRSRVVQGRPGGDRAAVPSASARSCIVATSTCVTRPSFAGLPNAVFVPSHSRQMRS
jgi:hypothetical protein